MSGRTGEAPSLERRGAAGTGKGSSSRRKKGGASGAHHDAPRPAGSPSSLVELKVQAPAPTHWLQDLGSRWGASVQVHVCRPLGKQTNQLLRLMEVVAPPEKMDEISGFLTQNAGEGNLAVTRLAPHRLLVRLVAPTPPICTTVFEMGAICTSCPFLPNGGSPGPEESAFTWGLLSPSASNIRPILDSFRNPESPPPKLLKVGKFHGTRDLTARQEAALEVAVRLGYFETPRRGGLAEVARAMGVSRATAMEVLRRALQKLTEQWEGGAPFPKGEPPSD